MPEAARTFRYRALTRAGERISGELVARDRAMAIARLQAQGLVPLRAEAAAGGGPRGLLQQNVFGGARLSAQQLADFMQQLATLIGSSIPVEQALGVMSGPEAGARARRVAQELLRRLRAGAGLGDAMAADPRSFPPVALSMVRAGEASGLLEAALQRLADYLRRSAEVRAAILSALVYPMLLVAAAAGSVVLILAVVLPQLKPLFAHAHKALPWETRLALAASDGLRDGWWAGLLLLALSFALLRRLLREPTVLARCDRALLAAPLLGAALRKAETARFARTLGALVGSNVTLPVALALGQAVLVNSLMAEAVDRVRKALKEGGGLADPLAGTGVFPDLTIQFIRIGEATGRLDEMLLKQADLFDAEVRRLIDRGLALLVPVVTILMGILVGGIVASVMAAILSVNDLAM
jgi:general secretion pathway protein F